MLADIKWKDKSMIKLSENNCQDTKRRATSILIIEGRPIPAIGGNNSIFISSSSLYESKKISSISLIYHPHESTVFDISINLKNGK